MKKKRTEEETVVASFTCSVSVTQTIHLETGSERKRGVMALNDPQHDRLPTYIYMSLLLPQRM